MNPPRVVHIVLGLSIGGLERVVVNLARGLQRLGFQNDVVCLEQGGEFASELATAGIPVHVWNKRPGMDWSAIGRLASFLRTEKIAIVHTHNPTPHFHGAMAALLARTTALVHTKHGRNYPENRKRVFLNRLLASVTDAIVPVSDNAAQVALQIERVNPRKLRRIWNGVDTELYKPRIRSSLTETTPPVLGTVARLSAEKDQKTLLRAFQLLRQTPLPPPLPRLVFVGDGPRRVELQDEAQRLGVNASVDFLGIRSDVATLLPSFTLFTLSSITEGISMTILEAMACALPVVATDVGGNREIVNPPQCGLIVPPRNPQALAAAWLELLRNPTRRMEMGIAARNRVVTHFSVHHMVNQYATLYRELLQTNRAN